MSNPKLCDPKSYSLFMASVRNRLSVVDGERDRELAVPRHKRQISTPENLIER
jgi:hypothetical protein